MANPFAALAAWSASHPVIAIVASLLVAGGVGAGMGQADQGRINELFVPDDLPALAVQRDIEDIWGETEGAFFLYIANDPTNAGLLRAAATDMDRLAQLPGVIDVQGLPAILQAKLGDLDDANDQQIRSAAADIKNSPAGKPFIVNDALLVRVTLEPVADIPAMIAALDGVRDQSKANADIKTAGVLYIEDYQQQNAGGDVQFLMPLSLAVVLTLLAVLFRRFQDVAVPVVTVLLSIIMAYGTVAWAGMALAPPSFIVMPLLLGLGIDYMLHIVYAYREQGNQDTVAHRFTIAGRQVGYPVFYTAATTLIGFGSFLASNIPQIRTWGLLIGSGALYAFLLGFVLLPALYRIRRRKQRTIRLPLEGAMDRLASLVMGRRKTVLALVLLTTVGLGTAAAYVDIEDSIDFDPDDDVPAVANLNAIQDRFGGQSLVTFLVHGGTRAQLEAFETALDDDPLSGFVDGPIHRLHRAGTPNGPVVGSTTEGTAVKGYYLVTVGYRFTDMEAALDRFEELAAASPLDARMAGNDVLQRESQEVFLSSLAKSTLIALVLVVALLAAVFRRPTLAALAFAPLVVTILWQLGIQTLVDIPINPITGVMTAMILGVGVDYSLHIMAHFQHERKAGQTSLQAAESAMRSVGRPVLAASITTVFAFSVLGFSSLLPLRHFGIVAAIVVTCAFIVSITLLPVLASYLPNLKPSPAAPTMPGAPFAAAPPATRQPAPAGPRAFTVQPRFADPAVEAWYHDTVREKYPHLNETT